MNMKPPPALPPPVKPTTVATAGSARMMSTSCFNLPCVAWKEMLWSARRPPLICPVSCCGKKPFGALMNKNTLSPITATRTSITSSLLPSAQSRLTS